jgi:hypothetical protein
VASCNWLLKKAHLLRYAPYPLQALQLDLFDQPALFEFFSTLLGGANAGTGAAMA